jgi:hypothetical protein
MFIKQKQKKQTNHGNIEYSIVNSILNNLKNI